MLLLKKYKAGGFVIETTFSFAFFAESSEETNCAWMAGKVDDATGEIQLQVFNLAKIAIDSKDNVTIELLAQENEENLNFIAIHILGLLSQKHQRFPLHATAILHEEKAILFTGLSGSGKSTCVKLLAEKGFTIIADEMAPLLSQNNTTYLLPACQAVYVAPLNSTEHKKWISIQHKINTEAIPVKSIYHLQFGNETATIQNLSSLNAVRVLQENHFKPFIKWDKESNLMRYNLCTEIIKNCSLKVFSREKNINFIEEAMNLLIKDL